MKNRRITRVLLLVLTLSLIVTVASGAGAANYTGDINGDGKITAMDAQLLAEADAGYRTLTDEQQEAAGKGTLAEIIDFILGREVENVGKEYLPGVVAIYTVEDLQAMSEDLTATYMLMNDLDLGGAQWTPVAGFAGSFEGNGHTISNLTIDQNVGVNQAFFGDATAESVITGLALRNVTLNAAEDAQFIGLAVGTSRGTLTDVTVTGTINDSRTQIPGGTTAANSTIYTGVLVGRTVEKSGAQTGGTSITVKDDTNTHSVEGLCADVKLNIQKDSELVQHNGLYGYLYTGTSVTGQWRDSTNNASNVSETMRQRQQQVVDYMNAMGSVAWTVNETLTFAASGVHHQVFEPGTTYYGLPYNGRNGSLERFLSCMEVVDGKYVAKSGLGDSTKTDNPMTGFAVYMGNDCSSAVCQAWSQVSPTRVGSYKIVNGQVVDSNAYEYAGGAFVRTTNYMYPSMTPYDVTLTNENGESVKTQIPYRDYHGIYPVGEWTTVGEQGTLNADSIVGEFAYNCDNVVNSAEVLNYNTEQEMGEAYAITHKADAIVGGDPAGHARLVVSYPVTIRNADGTIDMDKSFLVCTEQGDGLYDGNNSSWRINYRWSYNNLLAKDSDNKLGAEDGNITTGTSYSKCVYLPITIRALRSDYVKYAYVDEATKVVSPVSGKTYTNYRTVSSTVIVQDMNGKELFRNETFAGLESGNTYGDYYRGQGQGVDLAYAHGEAFRAFAEENLTVGQTYRYSVQLLLSNGQTLIVSRDSLHWKANGHSGTEFDTFTYNP